MKKLHLRLLVLIAILLIPSLIYFTSNVIYAVHEETVTATEQEEVPFDRPVEEIKKSIAPMNELNIFPCSDCHDKDWETDYTRRELGEPHSEVPGQFVNHDSENRWCLDCHSDKNRDKFRLLNGNLVEFNEYYRVCEQCHKRVYREWKMGVHGKRTGYWNGEKEYLHCAQCHNPHNPPFQPIKPMPAPVKPQDLQTMSSGDGNK